jgi:hypothetical protein
MSAKEEVIERSSRTSHEESEAAVDGMWNSIANPANEISSQGGEGDCKTRSGKSAMTRQIGPSTRYPEETSKHEESEEATDLSTHVVKEVNAGRKKENRERKEGRKE